MKVDKSKVDDFTCIQTILRLDIFLNGGLTSLRGYKLFSAHSVMRIFVYWEKFHTTFDI